ncbi:hypothetical protein DITRI_Ditri06bG0036000 [Diplodiscus trichospermus]
MFRFIFTFKILMQLRSCRDFESDKALAFYLEASIFASLPLSLKLGADDHEARAHSDYRHTRIHLIIPFIPAAATLKSTCLPISLAIH